MKPKLRKRSFLLDTDVVINILKQIPGYSSLPYQHSLVLYYASVSKKELYAKRGLTKAEADAIAKPINLMKSLIVILTYYVSYRNMMTDIIIDLGGNDGNGSKKYEGS